MSEDRRSDRIIRAWLDLMPDHAPDRAIASVMQAVEGAPQARRPFRSTLGRSLTMNRLSLGVAVVVLAVVAGGGAFLLGGAGPSGVGSSSEPPASPSAPSPSPQSDPLPSELQGRWMGSPRALLGTDAGTSLVFGPTSYAMTPPNMGAIATIRGEATTVGQGRLRLTTAGGSPDCGSADAGLYSWALSASGRVLTVASLQDDCADRAALVNGTYWLEGCRDPATGCLGDLDAGTYASQYVRPLLSTSEPWQPRYGGVTYTVPDGWANWSDYPEAFGLAPSAAFAATTPAQIEPTTSVTVLAHPAPESQATPCSGALQGHTGGTPADMLTWLGKVPGLHVGESTAVTVGGLAGASADVSVDPTTLVPCGGDQVVEYMLAGGEAWGIGVAEHQRLILLDAGSAGLLAIVIDAPDASTFDATVGPAMAVIESFQFH